MRLIFSALAIFVLLLGVVGTGIAFADDKYAAKSKTMDKSKSTTTNAKSYSQPTLNQKQTCGSPEQTSLKNALDDASKKAVALKEQLYKEWQAQSTQDNWETIVKTKLEGSAEMQNYLQLQKKYDSLYSSCTTHDIRQQATPVTPKKSCPNDEYQTAQKNIADIDQKYGELKRKYIEEGKSASSSGQYSGTAEQYAQDKLLNSDEIKKLQENRQKYELATRDCEQNYLPRQDETQKTVSESDKSCPQSDIEQLKIQLNDLDKRLMEIKEKTNPEWRELHDSGKIKEDWPEYARKIATASPEFSMYLQLQQKLDFLNKMCNDSRAQNSNAIPSSLSNVTPVCSDDAQKAKQMLEDAQTKYGALKTKYYEDWKSQSSAGTYSGTWDQYAQEKFLGSSEVTDINNLIAKYMTQAQGCLSYVAPLKTSPAQPQQYNSEIKSTPTKDSTKKTESLKASEKKPISIKKPRSSKNK